MKPITNSLLSIMFASSAVATDFHPRVLLSVGDEPIQMKGVGYSAPCWADIDGDGKKDLLVGQLYKGKITVFSGAEGIKKLGAGKFLKVGSKIAEIPGMW